MLVLQILPPLALSDLSNMESWVLPAILWLTSPAMFTLLDVTLTCSLLLHFLCTICQLAVSALSRNEVVLLTREPFNEYDKNAVGITTLLGLPLGFVPRTHNSNHLHEVTFGRIVCVGQTKKENSSSVVSEHCTNGTAAGLAARGKCKTGIAQRCGCA